MLSLELRRADRVLRKAAQDRQDNSLAVVPEAETAVAIVNPEPARFDAAMAASLAGMDEFGSVGIVYDIYGDD